MIREFSDFALVGHLTSIVFGVSVKTSPGFISCDSNYTASILIQNLSQKRLPQFMTFSVFYTIVADFRNYKAIE
jgi:hypothetical protein